MKGRNLPLLLVWTLASVAFSQQKSPSTERSFLPEELIAARAPDAGTVNRLLMTLTKAGRGRIRMLDLARSREGRPVRAIAATRADSEHQPDLPATLVVAGIRPQDEAGVRVAMELCARLAHDPALRGLLERRVFYIVPLLNPDLYGARLPYDGSGRLNGGTGDDDRDRRDDEDGAADIDSDGHVTMMRFPDPAGEWLPAPDPWNPDDLRLMRRADTARGEVGRYRLEIEGLDADGDGRRAEDGKGDTDLFVHFPAMWKPSHEVPGAGHSPLWEPEARGLIDLLLARRHVGTTYLLGGSGSQVLVPAWAVPGEDIPESDLRLLRSFGAEVREASGLEQMRAAYEQRRTHGTLLDWLYWEHGALPVHVDPWGVPEREREAIFAERRIAWQGERRQALSAARTTDPALDEDEFREEWEQENPERPEGEDLEPSYERNWLRWCERFAPEEGYSAWTSFQHPQLGAVEIGGWLPVGRTLPPDGHLEELGTRVAAAILGTCERAPQLEVIATSRRLDKRVDAIYEVTARVANVGNLPTATARAQASGLAAQVTLELLSGAGEIECLLGAPRQLAGHLAPGDGSETFRWLVEAPTGAPLFVRARCERGSVTRMEVVEQ